MSSHQKSIVEARRVCKRYRQGSVEVAALTDVDLELHAGEFTVLAGPSGSGKTTLLNLIGALDRPTSGQILLAGRELSAMTAAQRAEVRRTEVGFIFQAYNLLPVLSARENAELVLLLQGVPAADRRRRAEQTLAAVGLTAQMGRRPSELSGGQQQRVAVARAIAAARSLVLADEPTANLDSKSAEALLDIMADLNRTRGTTFIFSSHDPKVIERAHRVIHLADGRITEDEPRTAPTRNRAGAPCNAVS